MPQLDKKSLSERDICTKFITPALVAAGWNIDTQIREEVGFTDGRIYVQGKIHQRGKQKRADRTALIDQTVRNDFRHFKEAMTVIKHKQIDTAYNIYLALYQGLSDNNADADAYKEFSPAFFDLVIVDECHRGSARDNGKWREILDYFTKYGDLARKVIAALLDKYADDGGLDFENPEIIRLDPLNRLGSPVEIIRAFGGKEAYDAAIHALANEIYSLAA